jgi:hypothetical protein
VPVTPEGVRTDGGLTTEGASSEGGSGVDAQPASIPTMAANAKDRIMLVILLEALGALAALLFIVWWTMFSGRKHGEPPREDEEGQNR